MIKTCQGVAMGIYMATKRKSKSISNVIVHVPIQLFIEYMCADVKRETIPNVPGNLKDIISRLHKPLNTIAIHAFLTDSFNGIRDICSVLQNERFVKWAYGCVAHCLHNLCLYLTKTVKMTEPIKQCSYVLKTVKNTGHMRKNVRYVMQGAASQNLWLHSLLTHKMCGG